MKPDLLTWIAIDDSGKSHHVTPEDVLGATVELLGEVRVLHEVIARLHDHEDEEVRRIVSWACTQIDRRSLAPVAPPPVEVPATVPPEQPRKPSRASVVAFGLSALIGAITSAGWLLRLLGLYS